MKLGVSLTCFYYWENKFDISSRLRYINILKKSGIEAIELYFSEKEIINKDYKKFSGKLDSLIITVHLPEGLINKKFFENIKEMAEILKVKHFVIHADEYAKIKDLVKGIKLVIENCDKEKKGFQSLNEVKKLGKDICLDINHFEENFPGKLNLKIKNIKDNIKELHISALNNRLYDYPHKSNARHYLVYGSNCKLSRCLPKRALWIIEGIIPKNRLDLLKKEIELLRNF